MRFKNLWIYQNRELYPLYTIPHRQLLTFLVHEDDYWQDMGVRITSADPPPFSYRLVRECEQLGLRLFEKDRILSEPSDKTVRAWAAEPPTVWLRTGREFRRRSAVLWSHKAAWATLLEHLGQWKQREAWVWFDGVRLQDPQDQAAVQAGVAAAVLLGYHVSLEVEDVNDVAFWFKHVERLYHPLLSFRVSGFGPWRRFREAYPPSSYPHADLWLQLEGVSEPIFADHQSVYRDAHHLVFTKAVGHRGLMIYRVRYGWTWTPAGEALLRFLAKLVRDSRRDPEDVYRSMSTVSNNRHATTP